MKVVLHALVETTRSRFGLNRGVALAAHPISHFVSPRYLVAENHTSSLPLESLELHVVYISHIVV